MAKLSLEFKIIYEKNSKLENEKDLKIVMKIEILNLLLSLFDTTILGRYHNSAAATAAKSLQSCPTLCDPIDGSPPGSPVPGILQARTLEWVAISFSNAWKWKVKVKSLSRVRLLTTPWSAAYQAPPSMGFSRQGYWSGVPLPSPTITLHYTFKKTVGPHVMAVGHKVQVESWAFFGV